MKTQRKDYFIGPAHLILRKSTQRPQYGILAWGINRKYTLDVWVHRSLITFRCDKPGLGKKNL